MPRALLSSERRQEKGGTRGIKREAHPLGTHQLPGTDRWVDYATYREKTGTCETCGAPMAGHPQCEGCGSLCGGSHEAGLTTYRGHGLCPFCIKNWKSQEKAVGRETTWEEFRSPNPSLFD